jgi:hypothetical protein
MLLASSLAAIRETCRTPIENLKMLVNFHPPPSGSRTLRGIVRHYYAKDGIGVYFRGLVGMLRRNVPPQALPLACNDLFNATLPAYEDVWKSSAVKLVSGGLAGAVTSVVHSPFQAAKRLAQAELHANGRSGNPKLGDLVNAAKSHGVTGLFAFAHVALVGAFIFRAGQLGGFKVLQEVNPYAKDTGLPGFFSSLAAVTAARAVVVPLYVPMEQAYRRLFDNIGARTVVGQLKYLKFRYVRAEMGRGFTANLVVVAYDRLKLAYSI